MEHNFLQSETPLSNPDSRGFWKVTKITAIGVISLTLLFSGGVFVWAQQYENRLPPNTFFAGADVSGMDPESVRERFQGKIDALLTQGVAVQVGEDSRTLGLVNLSVNNALDHVEFDLEKPLTDMMSSHSENVALDTIPVSYTHLTLPTNREV